MLETKATEKKIKTKQTKQTNKGKIRKQEK